MEGGGEYREIIVLELRSMLKEEDVPLINVHNPFAGNIPGTDESIPFNEITDNLTGCRPTRTPRSSCTAGAAP